jgi:hypothetical protein
MLWVEKRDLLEPTIKIMILSLLMLSGCAANWTHSTANREQFYQDKIECERYFFIERQVAPVRSTPAVYDTQCEQYGNTTNCRTTQNQSNAQLARARQNIEQGGADLGRGLAMASKFNDCMYSKGYSK